MIVEKIVRDTRFSIPLGLLSRESLPVVVAAALQDLKWSKDVVDKYGPYYVVYARFAPQGLFPDFSSFPVNPVARS